MTANASGVATYTWTACSAAPDVEVVDTWVGTINAPIRITGNVTGFTVSGATVQAYETRGTLALSAGPYQVAAQNRTVTVRVIC